MVLFRLCLKFIFFLFPVPLLDILLEGKPCLIVISKLVRY